MVIDLREGRAGDATTTQLRDALHRYEVLVGQLADAPAPSGWRDPPAD